MDATVRVRIVAWFATAIVLSILATLLVTQAWIADAAPGDSDSTFVPTAGCRVADTRGTSTVGPRNTPLGADQTFTVTIHGSNGECTGALAIPTDAVGVALNVTAVNATASSNIRIFPANLTDVPLLSNLNVSAGAPPTPNKVDVKLSPDGKIKVYNFNGSVNIVIDIVGYYTNSTLQELAKGLTTANERIAALEIAQPFAAIDHNPLASSIPNNAAKIFASAEVTAPVDGKVIVSYSMYTLNSTTTVVCEVNSSTEISGLGNPDAPGGLNGHGNFAGSSVFDIEAGQSVTYVLACSDPFNGGASAFSPTITAIFTPAP